MQSGSDVPEAPSPVLVERRQGAAFLTLNRPGAMNAFSRALVTSLVDTLRALRDDPTVRALVITGAGDRAFCAGADLKERRGMTLDETREFLAVLNAAVNDVASFPRPVIAAINGGAFGGGFELALACDLRLAADSAELGLTEVRLGIIPGGGGTQRLARIAGPAVAKELIFTGRRISAARARELGIVSEVVPTGQLLAAAEKLAAEIASGGPLAVSTAKRAIDGGLGLPLPEALAHEQACYQTVLASEDRNEGLAAFMEKRPPVFKGR